LPALPRELCKLRMRAGRQTRSSLDGQFCGNNHSAAPCRDPPVRWSQAHFFLTHVIAQSAEFIFL